MGQSKGAVGHRTMGVVLAFAIVIGSASCASGAEPAGGQAPTSSPPELDDPVGLAAIGHSALTGEGSTIQGDSRANSWATGTNPDVESIYLRMIERRPETEGSVANAAVGGAVAATLESQAATVLEQLPAPELVILQTIDNDLRCDGTDAAHAAELGEQVRSALELIVERSPNTKVLVVSQVGRPLPHAQMRAAAGTAFPGAGGECDLFDANGQVAPDGAARLTAIIEGYEQAQREACEQVANCFDDGGAGSSFAERWEYFEGGDENHFNAVGLAALAEHMWPAVQAALDAS